MADSGINREITASLTARFVDDDDFIRTGRAMLEIDGHNFLHIPVDEDVAAEFRKNSSDVAGLADSARGYASNASSSAKDAKGQADSAGEAAGRAEGFASAASSSEKNAASSAAGAKSSASAASSSASRAAASEKNASSSEVAAKKSADAAATSEKNAKSSADRAFSLASSASESAEAAKNSEEVAGQRATAADEAAKAVERVGTAQSLGVEDLNDVTSQGVYSQDRSVNASMSRHYPVGFVGLLEVFNPPVGAQVYQRYTVYGDYQDVYVRGSQTGSWGAWKKLSQDGHTHDVSDVVGLEARFATSPYNSITVKTEGEAQALSGLRKGDYVHVLDTGNIYIWE